MEIAIIFYLNYHAMLEKDQISNDGHHSRGGWPWYQTVSSLAHRAIGFGAFAMTSVSFTRYAM